MAIRAPSMSHWVQAVDDLSDLAGSGEEQDRSGRCRSQHPWNRNPDHQQLRNFVSAAAPGRSYTQARRVRPEVSRFRSACWRGIPGPEQFVRAVAAVRGARVALCRRIIAVPVEWNRWLVADRLAMSVAGGGGLLSVHWRGSPHRNPGRCGTQRGRFMPTESRPSPQAARSGGAQGRSHHL